MADEDVDSILKRSAAPLVGLYRVLDPGMGLPSPMDAVYKYTKAEALEYAFRVWTAGGRMGGPLIDFVRPGSEPQRIFVDFTAARKRLPPPQHLHSFD